MNGMNKIVITVLGILLSLTSVFGQGIEKKVMLNWKGVQSIQGINFDTLYALVADGLSNDPSTNFTPIYFEKFALPANVGSCDILVTHTEWEPVGQDQIKLLTYPLQPSEILSPVVSYGTERGVNMAMLNFIPVVVNPEGGIMRLKSFTIDLVYIPSKAADASLKSTAYASHSVLAQGDWYKIKLDKTGIYKLTYADIQSMGVDMSKVKPNTIRLFGNGGGSLPEANSIYRPDDLTENAIKVVNANPDAFAPGDYILFYGISPDKITYNKTAKIFEHVKNIYSDFAYYFLNFDEGSGLRIEDQEQSTLTQTYTSASFLQNAFYEKDQLNLIISGKDWVGERMDANSPVFELPEFTFPNLSTGSQAWIRYRLTARASVNTTYTVKVNGIQVSTPSLGTYSRYIYGAERTETKSFSPVTDKVKVSFQYNGAGSSIGWLDWVELNVFRDMKFTGGQMSFADPVSVGAGKVTSFKLQGTSSSVNIWEVTNPLKVKHVVYGFQDGVISFALQTDSLRQFIAWDNTIFLTASFTEKVINQDLHAIASADMLIVTHKDFMAEANRLADFHRTFDGFKVSVVTNEQVYNEFSSGSPDIVAIRDLARLLYNRPEKGSKLRYLLLFGDGSYDFKDRIPKNTNKVLAFQTKESINNVNSIASDDFFGLFDSNEGNDATGLIDIGIGRFPVNTIEEAKIAVDKCLFYATNSEANMGDWRNKICFVADDGDNNLHFRQVEKQILPLINKNAPGYNVVKIYLNATKQISTPSGQRAPDAIEAINSNIENGVLTINYTGHGGETGWAEESILSVSQIKDWTNYNNMPIFMTATCEFSRFDDPGRVSAGEFVFLNPVGGAVALFTSTRLSNAGTNIELTMYFYDTLFSKYNGVNPRFGDVIASAKNRLGGGYGTLLIRNFVLLGDPALTLAYPQNRVITTQINGRDIGLIPDTISGMEPVEIKGIVAGLDGNKLTGYSGVIEVKVFDKVRTLTTLGSEVQAGDFPDPYTLQDNYIYQGKATVSNGDFTVNFIVPRDINYSYGMGKISYYAHNSTTDATGYSNQLVIGGSGDKNSDNAGPEISLYIDNLNFENGGLTGENPFLIAKLSDENGINAISNAIGHDIVATIDGDNTTSVVMNNFYRSDLDSYKSGVVNYNFSALPEGPHTLTLKAWDVFNNSSQATINFEVTKNMQLSITSMNAYPNPFNNEVKVEFQINLLDADVTAHLEVFNSNGSLVYTTDNKLLLSQGYKTDILTWNGRTSSGANLPPGVYLLVVKAGNDNSETVKAARMIKSN
jgi:hypothetical protein